MSSTCSRALGDGVTAFSGADGDGDGMVDDDDYNVWKTHFGQVAGSGSALRQSTAVPEPGTAVLTLCAIVGLLNLGSRGAKFESSSISPTLNRGTFERESAFGHPFLFLRRSVRRSH
jgi:hypothetical protein